jgi:hypothetical protein
MGMFTPYLLICKISTVLYRMDCVENYKCPSNCSSFYIFVVLNYWCTLKMNLVTKGIFKAVNVAQWERISRVLNLGVESLRVNSVFN